MLKVVVCLALLISSGVANAGPTGNPDRSSARNCTAAVLGTALFLAPFLAYLGTRPPAGPNAAELKRQADWEQHQIERKQREDSLHTVLNRFEGLSKEEKQKLVEGWHADSAGFVAFCEKAAGEFEFPESLRKEVATTAQKWLTEMELPDSYQPKKSATSMKLFTYVVSHIAADAAVLRNTQDTVESVQWTAFLTAADVFIQDEGQFEEAEAELGKKGLEGGVGAVSKMASKAWIKKKAQALLRWDRGLFSK